MPTIEERLQVSIDLHTQKATLYEQQNQMNEQARIQMLTDSANDRADRENQVAEAISNLLSSHPFLSRTMMGFNNSEIFMKNFLISEYETRSGWPIPNESKTPWIRVHDVAGLGKCSSFEEGELVVLNFNSCQSYNAGYTSDPPYASDWSASHMQFVIAPENKTSDEIDNKINEMGYNLNIYGGWWNGASRGITTVVNPAGASVYRQLYARFINKVVPDQNFGTLPQDIKNFGGNCSFSLNEISVFSNIKYKDVA